ncbi:MAG: 30S ribosomal protein S2 [Gammaproteobacteria bacterium RIFOXYB2_FULL_38_6]|nr:MAG: 30S ribosomal protein S2 [Gammaproteobacteria bacterium RIFOXYB2_FULL_38_6]
MKKITMRQMLESGVHFGHRTRYWNPQMAPYIYGARHDIHIINLEKTLPMFVEALEFIGNIIANRGKILFVGTKPSAKEIIREEAIRCGMPYVDQRWLGGMLTNYKTIRQSIKKLKDLEAAESTGGFDQFIKKEKLMMIRLKEKLAVNLDGIKNMGGLPDALFVIDVGHEKIAIKEANRLSIPVIAVVDTNENLKGVDYIIPGNDDAARAIRFYCSNIAEVIITARGPILEAEKIKAEKEKEEKEKVVMKKKAAKVKEEEKEKVVEVEVKSVKKTKAEKTEKKSAEKKVTATEETKKEMTKEVKEKTLAKKTDKKETAKTPAKKTTKKGEE